MPTAWRLLAASYNLPGLHQADVFLEALGSRLQAGASVAALSWHPAFLEQGNDSLSAVCLHGMKDLWALGKSWKHSLKPGV